MTPSQTIVRECCQDVYDSRCNRTTPFGSRSLTALDTLRLFKAAGPVLAQNEPWLSMAGLAFSVLEIDGVPVPPPATEAQIESLIDRLGDEGLAAIANVIKEEYPASETRAECGKLARHPVLIDCLYLIRNGVPFDVAFSLSATERSGLCHSARNSRRSQF